MTAGKTQYDSTMVSCLTLLLQPALSVSTSAFTAMLEETVTMSNNFAIGVQNLLALQAKISTVVDVRATTGHGECSLETGANLITFFIGSL